VLPAMKYRGPGADREQLHAQAMTVMTTSECSHAASCSG
jgi:hypothetical protein